VFYRFLTTLLDPLVSGFSAFAAKESHFGERLGKYHPPPVPPAEGTFPVWLHGASAGEVQALIPLVRALRERVPSMRLTLTTTSLTGRKIALEKGLADIVSLAPLDLAPSVRRAFDAFSPRLLLVAETEFWPLWLAEAESRSISAVLVNGRISDRSYPSYRRFRSFFQGALGSFAAGLVQTPLDRERLISLGAGDERVQVVGQMKYDLGAPDAAKVEAFRASLGLESGTTLFTFGSLREGEDEAVLAALPRLLQEAPGAKVVLAPRHFRNLRLFEKALSEAKVPWALRSRGVGRGWDVLVLDTMGELGYSFALSRAAFVGGTLVPVGGHNVMEPCLSGVPVCFGPHVANVREAAAALTASGGGAQVASAREVVEWMARYVDEARSRADGAKALAAVEPLRGATKRTLSRLEPFLPTRSEAT